MIDQEIFPGKSGIDIIGKISNDVKSYYIPEISSYFSSIGVQSGQEWAPGLLHPIVDQSIFLLMLST